MRIISIILASLLLTSCLVAWEPRIGMTYSQFRSHWSESANMDEPRFVGADGSTRVYESDDVFYYFVNDRLDRADQGQLFEQRIRVNVQN